MSLEFSKYVILVKFLKEALGERYEICLHSADELEQAVEVKDCEIAAVEKNETDIELLKDILNSSVLKKQDFFCGFQEEQSGTRKNSIFYIRDEKDQILGFLSIKEKKTGSVSVKDVLDEMMRPVGIAPNNIGREMETLMRDQIEKIWAKHSQGKAKLNKAEKMDFIREIFDMGFFRMKGAMELVSQVTGISLASAYRYIGEVIEE